LESVILAGNPNVGKSVLFYHLTGNYVTVSNYPGTTVEVARGKANIHGKQVNVFDTPGLYSLSPVTEEEAVTRRLLMENGAGIVVHVVDAKNLPRMLPLTLELLSCGFGLILVLNMMDEAAKHGVAINRAELARRLGVPVLEAAFTEGRGVTALKKEIARALQQRTRAECELPPADEESPYLSALRRRQQAERVLEGIFLSGRGPGRQSLAERLTLDPFYGVILMALVLYVGLYLVVGRFGAGTLVDLLEGTLFGGIIIPIVEYWVEAYVPWEPLRELLAREYGIMTLGFRYAFGVILPIVGTFFFMFSVLEDSGYLPRLAYLADGLMSRVGLNGRAVIPLTLGFGCGTMAVLVTRTLESKRERFIATFLLALAVPCSAQLGLMLSILSHEPYYLFIWTIIVGGMFLFCGSVLSAIVPGRRAPFFMELPPLRMPKLNAIFQKTLARMRWYFVEIIPVFIFISVLLFLLRSSGGIDKLTALLSPLLGSMGLPPGLSIVFIFGFFRRDYGAAGLLDLYRKGTLSGGQLLVAAVVLTLFLPCLAQLAVMVKERKLPATLVIMGSVALLAYAAGTMLRLLLGLPIL